MGTRVSRNRTLSKADGLVSIFKLPVNFSSSGRPVNTSASSVVEYDPFISNRSTSVVKVYLLNSRFSESISGNQVG